VLTGAHKSIFFCEYRYILPLTSTGYREKNGGKQKKIGGKEGETIRDDLE